MSIILLFKLLQFFENWSAEDEHQRPGLACTLQSFLSESRKAHWKQKESLQSVRGNDGKVLQTEFPFEDD